jgi:hypothetical protein
MILVYSDKSSSRLQYVAAFIFKEILQTPYSITTHKQGFREFDGIKLNYSDERIMVDELHIPNCGLLFETGIRQQPLEIKQTDDFKIFFQSSKGNNEFPFDIFSASFYLLSRYEEYLPHEKDKYGRYSHLNSLAYKEDFLKVPLVNTWINYFANYLKNKFNGVMFNVSEFKFIPTYDIDMAYSYLRKGFVRNFLGTAKSFSKLNVKSVVHRLSVLSGIKKDPFDNFDWLHIMHKQYGLHPVYFFLVADKNGLYDKNILPQKEAMIQLIKVHTEKYSIGLHPSWQSGDRFSLLQQEKKTLENISAKPINKSRQHYLRFNFPLSYRRLSEVGITEDYSMGYDAVNGFRASVASSFFWYDIEKEEQTKLRIYPFCYMDSATIFFKKFSYDEAYNEILYYYDICRNARGIFISVFHNHLLGYDNLKWRNLYDNFLKRIASEFNV